MSASRIRADRGHPVDFEFDGGTVQSFEGETVAAALLAVGVSAFGVTREGEPRLPMCNMGTCFDCAVTVDGQLLVRACMTDVQSGMSVTRHEAS
ncbi:(2Fe-2S)-binding protein [Leucobacter coleopterorum]|uniref:(2Fe-2S)-binding protein n=1 Tax=Leucobacter coleopterorum TaxID=2714933 RepID=A0ABX6JXP3_9MICO|nr:(2Fe-2S)-binding protein [Leucobacter coleopterorum]QIM17704.1 (2Fe-2S)-binding protein [Leucobacter coleopterorum]